MSAEAVYFPSCLYLLSLQTCCPLPAFHNPAHFQLALHSCVKLVVHLFVTERTSALRYPTLPHTDHGDYHGLGGGARTQLFHVWDACHCGRVVCGAAAGRRAAGGSGPPVRYNGGGVGVWCGQRCSQIASA
eukprot:364707-Chlamydomonas_euryale.AAC.21